MTNLEKACRMAVAEKLSKSDQEFLDDLRKTKAANEEHARKSYSDCLSRARGRVGQGK